MTDEMGIDAVMDTPCPWCGLPNSVQVTWQRNYAQGRAWIDVDYTSNWHPCEKQGQRR